MVSQNKKYGIDKTLTIRKDKGGVKVFKHVGGKTKALEKKPISEKTALKQIRDVTEVEVAEREHGSHHRGSKQHKTNVIIDHHRKY